MDEIFIEKSHISEVYPIVNITKKVYALELHCYPVYEFFYLKSGYIFFEINGKVSKLKSGDVVFIEPLIKHKAKGIGNGEFEYCSLVFDKSVFGSKGSTCRDFFDSIRVNRFVQLPSIILDELRNLCDNKNKKMPGYDFLQTTVIHNLISYIIQTKQYQTISVLHHSLKYNISAIDKAVEFIKENYKELIQLQDVLDLTNYSKSHFIKLFKDVTGYHFTEYVNKYRIERACLELLYSKKNITEIASEFGFNNIQYFSRVFKQYMNCTPKQFQKNGKM